MSSENARDSMADLSVGNNESWAGNNHVSLDNKGKFNRNGTWKNHLIQNLMDEGLMDMEDIKKNLTKRQLNDLTKIMKQIGLNNEE